MENSRFRFRAWHAGNKNEQGAFYRGHEPKMLYDGKPGDCLRWLAERQNITGIMQFTGLKDRNGVEIWEGDLLEEEAGYLFEVVWDEEWAKFRLQWRTKAIQYPEWNRGKKMAAVGNIYEHSHLLEPQ